ncbi:hypothetical protein P3S68_022375 [Capsicum galapagoense]
MGSSTIGIVNNHHGDLWDLVSIVNHRGGDHRCGHHRRFQGISAFIIRSNLNGLFGGQSGTTLGYLYLATNKNMVVNWGENTLYDYLLNPKKVRLKYAFI